MSGIEIIRDVDGIAHVRAPSLDEAFEGQGYAAAEDRLWQMELDRRRALGRLAEVVGPAAVAADTFHRAMGLAEHAQRSHDVLTEETRRSLAAYARGVNRYLASLVEKRPDPVGSRPANDASRTVDRGPGLPAELAVLGIEPEPWEPWHSLALYEVRHLAMGTYEAKLWRSGLVHQLGAGAVARLWPASDEVLVDPDAGEQAVPVAPAAGMGLGEAALRAFSLAAAGPAGEQGSNNLAIAGARTATGRPILAGDPHRAIDLPNVYWQNHLTCTDPDDPVDVIGLSFPGVPGFPHFGHNRNVAWCITHGMADDQDLFVVHLRGRGDVVDHRHAGGWREADVHREDVAVRGGGSVTIDVVRTHLGPVVADHPDGERWPAIVLRWTATAALDTTFDALVPMLRAGAVGDLDQAFEPWVVPVNNVLMADTSGTIAYRMRGRLAVRDDANGWTAVPFDDPAHEWGGFVPDADLPRWRDPARGFLVTSNNRIAADGPYVSHDFAHPTRARRLTGRLGERSHWDVEDVAALLGDTHSRVSAALATRLLEVAPWHGPEAAAAALLDGWDGHMDAGSAAAALVGTARAEAVRLLCHQLGLVRDRLPGITGPTLHQRMRFVNARFAWWVEDPTIVSGDLLATALRLAVRSLELAQGPDPSRWRWGAAHRSRWSHPLLALRPDLAGQLATPPVVELGGDNECVWATSTAPPSTDASNAQVARYVFDVGDWDRSGWIVPHGVSGDARSAHHTDQLEDWAAMRLRPMRFSTAAVDAATVTTTVLGRRTRP